MLVQCHLVSTPTVADLISPHYGQRHIIFLEYFDGFSFSARLTSVQVRHGQSSSGVRIRRTTPVSHTSATLRPKWCWTMARRSGRSVNLMQRLWLDFLSFLEPRSVSKVAWFGVRRKLEDKCNDASEKTESKYYIKASMLKTKKKKIYIYWETLRSR